MRTAIDERLEAEWWEDNGLAVVVRGPGFVATLDLGKMVFLDDVPDDVRLRAAEIVARVVEARQS